MSDDLLNAYLDDELDADERAAVEADLDASSALRQDLAELSVTRALLRQLPEVEPRRPLVPARTEAGHRRRAHRLPVAVATVAAIWLLVLSVGLSLGSLPVVPEVDQFALQHAAASESDMPMPFVSMDPDDMIADDPAIMSGLGDGMDLESVYQLDDVVQARYSDGEHVVSVFHEPGSVDWDDMPASGKTSMMDGETMVWQASLDEVNVVVVERGDLIVTVVSDGDMDDDMAMMATTMVPEVEQTPSLWSRLKAAPGNILDRL